MTDPKHGLRTVQVRSDRAIDRLFRPVAAAIPEIVERAATRTADGRLRLTPLGAEAVRVEIDRLLDGVYGTHRGGPSPLEDVIVTFANRGRARAVRPVIADLRRRLRGERELLRQMEA